LGWILAILLFPVAGAPERPPEGTELIGTPAPAWGRMTWIQSDPLRLEDLAGKVVLLRWWTDTCRMCARSAPALAAFHADYADRGLVVIGMYHPKPITRTISVEEVQMAAERRELRFPVALDLRWSALRRYWLNGPRRRATSVSFLIDKRGVIRHIHPGPEYHLESLGDDDPHHAAYLDLRNSIEKLLEEPFPEGG
jgi:peroxiredoxin